MKKTLFISFLVLMFTGCGSLGQRNVERLTEGMTIDEVVALMGQPERKLATNYSNNGVQEVFQFYSSRDNYAVEFWNGRLVGVEYLYTEETMYYVAPVYIDRPIYPGRPIKPNRPNRPNRPNTGRPPGGSSEGGRPGSGNSNTGRPGTGTSTGRPINETRPESGSTEVKPVVPATRPGASTSGRDGSTPVKKEDKKTESNIFEMN